MLARYAHHEWQICRFVDDPAAWLADLSVREVYATLLDEGRHLCSIATMYRLLRALGENRERRARRRHPRYPLPRLVATPPTGFGAGT